MKILIELPTWMGDTVMVTPAIENLIKYYNDSEITLIGSNISIEVFINHPKVVKTLVLDKKYTSLYKASKSLGKFDFFFTFRSSLRSKILQLLISSNRKYIYNKKTINNRHQVEQYNDFVNECLNANFPAGKLVIHSNRQSLINNSKPIVGINPGASYGIAKRWNTNEFAELSNQYDITIFGGPDEADIAGDIETLLIGKGITNYKNLVGDITIQELISRISDLDLFITGDSGPMHVAASFQIPTVAIFSPTKVEETSQWMNAKNIIVKKDLDCQPCMKRICPLKHNNCMKLIKAKDVLNAVNSL